MAMALRPEIFLSAVVPELNAGRKAVKQALLEMGARPVEQTDLSIEYGPLHGVLSQLIGPCEAVIHLAGFHYGMEPAERTLHAPRRSFSQYEIDVARILGKPIFVFAAMDEAALEAHGWEDEEKRLLQHQHRLALQRGDVHYTPFHSIEQLGRLVQGLRGQLIVRRSLARLPRRPMGARFIGRQRLLQELMDGLAPGRLDVLHPQRETGIADGFGKSCLAVEMGWRLHDERRFDYVLWMPAGPRADLEASLAALARSDALALLSEEVMSHRLRLQAVLRWLADEAHAGRWVMIIDGVDDQITLWSLRTLLPHLRNGALLLTGRLPAWAGVQEHTVGPFTPEQAREFFASRLERSAQTAPAERQAWDRLAESLGCVPLALDIAARHLLETKRTAREFLAEWTASHKLPSAAQGPTAVVLIEKAVAMLDPFARTLLRTLSCLAGQPAAIPVALFEHRGDWPQTSASIAMLVRRGLLGQDETNQTVSLHRLVREIVRDRMTAEELSQALGSARAEVDAVLQRPAGSLKPGAAVVVRELLIPHCRALMGQLNGHPLEVHAVGVARALGDWLRSCGRLMEAETFYRRALAIEEKRLGPQHRDLAPRLREVAAILRSRRQFGESEQLYRRLLALHEQGGRPDLGAYATDITQLAAGLRAANRLGEAETLCREALEIAQQASGPDHPKVAMALHHLAGVLEAQHRSRKAEKLYRRALDIEERAFGYHHPRLVNRLYHLAQALVTNGRYPEAEALYQRALPMDEQVLGVASPDLIPALECYASLLEEMENWKGAEALHRRALLLLEQALGLDHPETAMAQTNLAGVLDAQGHPEAALELFQRAADTLSKESRRSRGHHPQLRSALRNLAAAWRRSEVAEEEVVARLEAYQSAAPRRERSVPAEEQIERTLVSG